MNWWEKFWRIEDFQLDRANEKGRAWRSSSCGTREGSYEESRYVAWAFDSQEPVGLEASAWLGVRGSHSGTLALAADFCDRIQP